MHIYRMQIYWLCAHTNVNSSFIIHSKLISIHDISFRRVFFCLCFWFFFGSFVLSLCLVVCFVSLALIRLHCHHLQIDGEPLEWQTECVSFWSLCVWISVSYRIVNWTLSIRNKVAFSLKYFVFAWYLCWKWCHTSAQSDKVQRNRRKRLSLK